MNTFENHVENAFNLDYLESPEFPKTEIKSIGVVGGGTAGYLTALALQKCHPSIKVTVIESSRIPVIGVGESTTSEILPFLHGVLEIDPNKFFKEVEPTLKFGIRFDWGCPGDYEFNFNFFAGHLYESYYYEGSIQNANWPSVLMTENKLPIVRHADGSVDSFLNNIPFSYHIDNKKLIGFLNREIKSRGIEILDAEVTDVHVDSGGFVSSLETKDGKSLSYGLYIDCSGFRSKILGQTLQTEFLPYKTTLVTDKALTFNLPNKGVVDCYTSVITMNNGWCWKIPMRNEDHLGYVHSSGFCDEKTALAEAREKFGHFDEYKMVEFRSGRHRLAWNGNVFALGNAYAFIEPLESTAIQAVVHSLMLLCRIMPNSHQDESSIAALNQEIAATWDTFRWFLGVHYKFNKKLQTPFWKWCNENTEIGDAKRILALFEQRPPLSAGKFGTDSGYSALESLVFNSYSYDSMLFGQKLVSKPLAQPKMTKKEYFARVHSYRELTKSAVSQFDLHNDSSISRDGLMEQFFDDPNAWIWENHV